MVLTLVSLLHHSVSFEMTYFPSFAFAEIQAGECCIARRTERLESNTILAE